MSSEQRSISVSPDDKKRIDDIVSASSFDDDSSVLRFGSTAQQKVTSYSNEILQSLSSAASESLGGDITDLVLKLKESEKKPALYGVPLLGSLFYSASKHAQKNKTISEKIEGIAGKMQESYFSLEEYSVRLKGLCQNLVEHCHEVELYIEAGKLKMKEMKEKELQEAEDKAKSGNIVDLQNYQNIQRKIDALSRKIVSLEVTRTVAIQNIEQISLINNNNQLLSEKVYSSIFEILPIWKTQFVIAHGLDQQQSIAMAQRELANTTNRILLKNSKALKESTYMIKEEYNRPIVDIETIRQVNQDILSTLGTTRR